MNERDETRLHDMLHEAYLVQQFTQGKSRFDLEDELLAHAVVRALEVIGEAAARITPETKATLPQFAWDKMVGMRNRIVHDYNNVDLDIVWDTVVMIIPDLIAELERVL
jgi:uncharacterized protein with HEPN domain